MPKIGHFYFFILFLAIAYIAIYNINRDKGGFQMILKLIILLSLLFSGSGCKAVSPDKTVIEMVICPGPGCDPS